ncbi:helix-turn-helix domain-containing protein [Variovorax sp. Sphag1AA]|uniref:helix-turn-helix domain-containing protein n=1 Tax=Variovorax sp. Sphag1AA TaxID=2587027 RepID=UPI0018084AC4|nr:helix-turn-helix transcriptional regulator [Variovorax sp. Sphag1AA]MBB3180078.1 transcriptional regulator with XRE-family HTH domain [Variovorax sp. Sphag1AA]
MLNAEIQSMRSNQDPALLRAFAAELKARRGALAINQETLAYASELNRTFVAKLELATTSPSLTTLFRLANGLEIAPWELVLSVQERYEKELSSL